MDYSFNHVGIRVRNLDKTLDFYTKYFGAEFRRGLYIPSGKTIGAYVQIGTFMLEFLSPLCPDENTTYGLAHIAYTVDDLQKAYEELEANGHKFRVAPKRAGSGDGCLAFVPDPNGVDVELIQRGNTYISPSWKATTEVIEFDHASAYAKNLQPAIDFYTKDLGMSMLHHYRYDDRGFDMVYMNKGNNIMELLHNDVWTDKPNLMGHIALRVNDTAAFISKLEKDGVTVATQPRELATKNGLVGNVLDPDGNVVELIDRVSLFEVK